MKRSLQEAARAVGGTLTGPDLPFASVSTDSRTLEAGALFVALRGPKFDGGDYAAAAAAAGAVGVLVDRPLPLARPQILVRDTLQALQALAQAWRREFELPVIAVAGSNGKTTCKEMIAAILSRNGACLSTRGNLNNHIGVPLTLLRLDAVHRSAVVEVGANRLGDVAALMPLVRPTVGLITNAGAEHLQGFGDLDGVARGEGETIACLDAGAAAVINADDAYADYWRELAGSRRIIAFGRRRGADFVAANAAQGIEGGEFVIRFTLVCAEGESPIVVRAGGVHNVMNAAAAAAAAAAAGATLADITAGLADFRAVAGRLQLKMGARSSWIIDDSYNANPSSVRAGLDVLAAQAGVKWLVFADMGELGASAEASHAEIGAYARACGVARLFALGRLATRTVEAFGSGAEWFADCEALIRRLQGEISPAVTVLVKGSRVNRLERVVAALTGAAAKPAVKAS
ncbi:MAG TPA: UDP-N-acetylmuramoyl-tripeptide--D-alanyl-D-alanine ligase [Steroidobacteraceae bacterium]|nr:UDP-N-acetylmuramoyl-tripeptide--D-alanyl-D-alanine ligase [Steroidobacteraceae bacterium]